ncbi:MAG: hypothetical protein H6819_07060 [Phycisphaerales bacterium]|nr:hypothetical protein [Phycisphaerales bacterium]MCB9855341.1 hypothetical protein [Phycisphaerales bacterium]MCB9862934.1 hypothetical protein [Phycisphaerales bacterium]
MTLSLDRRIHGAKAFPEARLATGFMPIGSTPANPRVEHGGCLFEEGGVDFEAVVRERGRRAGDAFEIVVDGLRLRRDDQTPFTLQSGKSDNGLRVMRTIDAESDELPEGA